MKNRIILITGPKHSGKSVTARTLAGIMGESPADLDETIEKRTGKSPRELFKEGPEIFRKAEALALLSLLSGKARIIAAGGGLIDNQEALELLACTPEALTVYLEVSAETAWNRILYTARGGELPPFLNTPSPRKTHFALHTRRAEAYKTLAQITISGENKTPEEIAHEIAERLNSL
jgi:shikimate kinase